MYKKSLIFSTYKDRYIELNIRKALDKNGDLEETKLLYIKRCLISLMNRKYKIHFTCEIFKN